MDEADEVEAPNVFRVVIASELLARAQWSTTGGAPLELLPLRRQGGLDALFAALCPRLAFDVRDPWTSATVRVSGTKTAGRTRRASPASPQPSSHARNRSRTWRMPTMPSIVSP